MPITQKSILFSELKTMGNPMGLLYRSSSTEQIRNELTRLRAIPAVPERKERKEPERKEPERKEPERKEREQKVRQPTRARADAWNELKNMGNPLGLVYRNSNIMQIRNEITRIMNEQAVQAEQAEQANQALVLQTLVNPAQIRFTEVGEMKMRLYYVNGEIPFDDETVPEIVRIRLQHALNTGITPNSHYLVHINLVSVVGDQVNHYTKVFKQANIDDIKTFAGFWYQFVEKSILGGSDGNIMVTRVKVSVIRENRGGCYKGGQDKLTNIGDTCVINPRSKNNNCFFACIKDYMGPEQARRYNVIRQEFNIEKDGQIPISVGLAIFQKYNIVADAKLSIFDSDTKIWHGDRAQALTICLEDNHYTIRKVSTKLKQKCPDCLRCWNGAKLHTCDAKRVKYVNAKIKKTGRYLLSNMKAENGVNNDEIIHYDLETYRRTVGDHIVQTPYVLGYTSKQHTNGEFRYFAGDDCIEQFVSWLVALDGDVIINAFNGANFDSYFLVADILKRGVPNLTVNNGSIIGMKYSNIKMFDICKHLQGSLKSNLKEMKCDVQKGDFNHDLATRWEEMVEDLKTECLLYLRGDVMGLSELYGKVNTAIFDKYKVNITSYISTSSLTFNIWKSKMNKEFIMLPTSEQETAFRQAVRGGRTYKSKHKFVSTDRESFLRGDTKFDDIKDYIVDADVVSLYPTAMAKYEYPVGDCIKLSDTDIASNMLPADAKIGIYEISYIANKNLAHAVGGRRDETGKLWWDLTDSRGWYSSVDVEDMIANGYKITYHSGYYWTQTAPIFADYINELFADKAKAEKGTATYTLAKLFMNALYGKMIQRPIYTKSAIIQTNSEYWKFWGQNTVNELTEVGKYYHISGSPRDEQKQEKCITKPTHLGVFILAYSRRIMLNYMKEANPYFDCALRYSSNDRKEQLANDFYYTDTDSLQMHVSSVKRIARLGDKTLGGITDDLGDARILRGIWVAPKLYMLEYVKRGDSKLHYHFRGKGLSNALLSVKAFESMGCGESLTSIRPFQMKRVHVKRTSYEVNDEIGQFSILYAENVSKTVNTTAWAGRCFSSVEDSNDSVCWA